MQKQLKIIRGAAQEQVYGAAGARGGETRTKFQSEVAVKCLKWLHGLIFFGEKSSGSAAGKFLGAQSVSVGKGGTAWARSPLLGKGAPVEEPLGGLVLQLMAQRVGDGHEGGVEEFQRELRPGNGRRQRNMETSTPHNPAPELPSAPRRAAGATPGALRPLSPGRAAAAAAAASPPGPGPPWRPRLT